MLVSFIMLAGKGAIFPLQTTYAAKHGLKLGDFDSFLRNAIATAAADK